MPSYSNLVTVCYMVAKKKIGWEKSKYNFQEIDYPNQFWNYDDDESIDNNIVFLKKLKNSEWEESSDRLDDLFKCFTWEMSRTSLFDNPSDLKLIENAREEILKYKKNLTNCGTDQTKKDLVNGEWLSRNKDFFEVACEDTFPFNNPEWPFTSYLSHPQEKRASWSLTEKINEEVIKHQELFSNGLYLLRQVQGWVHEIQSNISDPATNSETTNLYWNGIKLSFHPEDRTSTSVPMMFNIGVDWTKDEFIKQATLQWMQIKKERKKLIEAYSDKGAVFNKASYKRTLMKKAESALRQIGHYRLLKHCNLDNWDLVMKIMPKEFQYADEITFLKAITNAHNELCFPKLDFEKENSKGHLVMKLLLN